MPYDILSTYSWQLVVVGYMFSDCSIDLSRQFKVNTMGTRRSGRYIGYILTQENEEEKR
jgi:hypothetical protein